MEKRPPKPIKTLRLRKEALKFLNTTEMLRVHGGDAWDVDTLVGPACIDR